MKKVVVVLLVCVMMTGLFAAGGKESQKAVVRDEANLFGTPENPVKVTYLCKDVNPNDEGNPELVRAIVEGLAKEGKYIDFEILDAPAGSYATEIGRAHV